MSEGELHQVSVEIGRLTAEVSSLCRQVNSLEDRVASLTALKHRGAGVLVGVSLVASALGSLITFLFGRN